MQVAILDPVHPAVVEELSLTFEILTWEDEHISSWPQSASAVIVRNTVLPSSTLAAASRLKVIGKHGVGTDNIDLGAAHEHGIVVVNAPGGNSEAVAELTIGLAVALARRISLHDRLLRAADPSDPLFRSMGTELLGKTIGIIGVGNVGRRVAQIFHAAFAARTWGYDPYLDAEAFAAEGIVRAQSLDELLAHADFVTVHAPLSDVTRSLIGRRELAKMHRGAFLVNVARAGIVDEDALFEALSYGAIAGAASDVFATEPPPATHPLLSLSNFIASPHVGAMTHESMERTGRLVAREVAHVLCGGEPRTTV